MELVLNTFGTSLNRDNEGFVISNEDGRQRIPADSINCITIGKGSQITSDAIMLAVEREIEVIFTDRTGQPIGRIWSPKYGSISSIRKGQVNFTFSKDAVSWIKDVICRKIENQQALILTMIAKEDKQKYLIERTIRRLEDYKQKIKLLEGEIVNDISATLRGWEGQSSKIYFETLNEFIPEKYRFENRTQRPAMDIANALLNYGYGIMYGRIEGDLIKSGIDPYIGVLHRDDYNRPVLAFDVIEIYRIWVDYVVFSLLSQNVITDEFFSVRSDGSYWLESLGRRIMIQSLNDYLEETVTVKGISRSRSTQIQLYAQSLAQKFKSFEK
jgi:CRISPR-associated protein Cas1